MNVTIKALTEDDVDSLVRDVPFRPQSKHRERLAQQERDEAVYLGAWLEGVPVGHVLVKWRGRAGYPEVEDLHVATANRRQGIGRRLMEEAEHVVTRRGFDQIGLAVVSDNAAAWSLYETLGYVEARLTPWWEEYPIWDEQGTEHPFAGLHLYRVKRLAT